VKPSSGHLVNKWLVWIRIYRSWVPLPNKRDTFHNLVFNVDKTVDFGIVDSTILINFLFPEGGDGRRKTFKIPAEIGYIEKSTLECYPSSKCI